VTTPYADIGEHVADELRRVWLRVEYQIRLGWTKGQPTHVGEDAVVGPEDMGRIFAAARGDTPPAGDEAGAQTVLHQWLEAHRDVEARLQATVAARTSPLAELVRVFGLTPRQWATLMFALLPEIDPSLVQAYRYLTRDPHCSGLDGRLLAQLVYDLPRTRPLMARDLSPSSPLLRRQLIEVTMQGAPSASLMFRRLRAATRLVYLLDGGGGDLDPDLADVCELRRGSPSGTFPRPVLDRATATIRSAEVVLAIQGQRGLGKRLLLEMAAAHWGKPLLTIDAQRLVMQPPPIQVATVRAIVRELMLHDAVPAVVEVDDVIGRDNDSDELPAFFRALVAEWSGPLAITICRERMPRILARPLVHLVVEVPTLAVRTTMWREVVPSLSDEGAEGLSARFAIPGGIIVAAAQAAAAERLAEAGPPDAAALDAAVAAQLHQRIARLGKRLPTPYDVGDLIVDDDTLSTLQEIVSAARERRRIRQQFKLRGAQGLSVLFSGLPGVGKTMSGTVLAKQLGLDIYEIDLSQVVSKWLGETEKNLSDVFDAAEPGHVVLLFNEADSLFGKRTSEVKSSNDRYANLETNYLLQRLERFNGLAILTTNLTSAIDQAFKRRFTYDVFFSFPSPDMRAELWRRTLPERSAADIDFDALAERYELSGGFIKVACERAAYQAGGAGTEITDALLRSTIERMYRERGKLSTVGPLE
jgi:hypothetical protein